MDKIAKINDEFFGLDKSKTYIKDDFYSALRGTIVRSILIELLIELNKNRTKKQNLPDGATAFGDFDPDNAGFFADIFYTYEKGWMLDFRILLGGRRRKVEDSNMRTREKGSGGKFIDDLTELVTDDFMNYYIQPDRTIVPNFLLQKIIKENSTNTSKFITDNYGTIDAMVALLVAKAKEFQSKGYHEKIIKDYEALELHKDNCPEKYNIRTEDTTDFPFVNKTTIRSPKSRIAIRHITTCLNDFAEIIYIYQKLVSKNTSFLNASWPLDTFVDRTLKLFVKELPQDIKAKISNDVIKYLHTSIDLVAWDHKKI